jgi:hypothetical protein
MWEGFRESAYSSTDRWLYRRETHLPTDVFQDVRLQPHLEVYRPDDEADGPRLDIENSL